MPITTYSDPPHFDDFNTSGVQFTGSEEKNYLRILFQPGRSVQVRELNQLQSMLQSQIDKLGGTIYKEGPVLDGRGNIDNDVKYIDIAVGSEDTGIIQYFDQLESIRYNSNGNVNLRATVLHYQLNTDGTYRFFIRYDNSIEDNSEQIQEYSKNYVIANGNTIYDDSSNIVYNAGSQPFATVQAVGNASVAKIDGGVFYVKGEFVYNDPQTLFITHPSVSSDDYEISGKLVLSVVEKVVKYTEDATLLDNATGHPNDTAPGADRYAIELSPLFISDKQDLQDLSYNSNDVVIYVGAVPDNSSFVTLLTLDRGAVVKPARTEYTQLDRKFATRTNEESGDYCVKPFKLDLREYLNDKEGNRGRYTAEQIVANEEAESIDAAKQYGEEHYLLGLEPSVAYVQGYRVNLQNKREIQVDKARQTTDLGNSTTTLTLGNYVVGEIDGDNTTKLPDFSATHTSYSISDGSDEIGTCKVRSLDKISNSRYHLHLYDIEFEAGKKISDAVSISNNTFSFRRLADTADFELLDVSDNSLIFPLPYSVVDSTNVNSIKCKGTFDSPVSTGNANEYTISRGAGDSYEFFSTATSDYIGFDVAGDTTRNLTEEPNTSETSVTLTFDGPVTSVIAPIEKAGEAGSKTVAEIDDEEFQPAVEFIKGAEIVLANHDIIEITSITYVDTDDNNIVKDITDQFTLDNGQRDNYYLNGKLTYNGETDLSGKTLDISYKYFSWTEKDYFSVDSYDVENGDISYSDLPYYKGIALADSLDFRPYKATDGTIASPRAIDPNSLVSLDKLNVYLPRYDKVVVSTIGDFSVIQGTPSLDPIVPPTPGDSMALYELFVPAYTFSTEDIDVKQIDNRRYTMRDIGNIEKRVKNLEYYTSLSLLEQEATEKKIFADGGEERFKNGILVDSFIGHNIGNPFDSNYKCAIDQDRGILRPSYTTTNIQFGVDEIVGGNTSYQTQETLSLPRLTDEILINQPYASVHESVNPFDVASWLGVMKLTPSMDEWKETRQRPDVVINSTGAADAIQFLAEEANVLGTKWNEWETNWVGVDVQKQNVKIARSNKGGSSAARAARLAAKKALTGSNSWRPLRGSITTTTTTSEQAREGIRNTMSFREQQENLGERVVDISFVPFIRSRRIEIKGEMFKPGTKLYVFFDGVDISDYCTKITNASTPYEANAASVTSHFGQTDTEILSDVTTNELITDDAGDINIACYIPNNASIRFKTGERLVKLTDSARNNDTEATSYSFATYTASGIVETKETTILSTRIPEFDQTRLSDSRTLTDVERDVKVRYYDPLAQSFVIGEIATGTSITKVDLFFQKTHTSIPVTMHLVTVENGVPTQSIVPFSKVVKKPFIDGVRNVLVSDDASVATTFEFDAPVYLQPGVEYAIVVMSNSPEYRLWMAETGGDDVNNQGRIDKNPYAGVSFKSQNASTWTPDQSRDFKFTMYRAKYDTNVEQEYTFTPFLSDESTVNVSNVSLISEAISLPKTSVAWEISYSGNSTFTPINPNETVYLDTPKTLRTTSSSPTMLKATLSSTSDYISPTLDMSRLSILGITNVINNPAVAEIPTEDENGAIVNDDDTRAGDGFSYLEDSSTADVQYITRTVDLNDPADRLNIYLLGNRPTSSSNIRVLVKLKTSDTQSYDEVEWYEMKPAKAIPVNSDGSYSEIEFDFNPEALDTSDTRSGIEFTSFVVKIVLSSADIVNIPTVQDFRAIATFGG